MALPSVDAPPSLRRDMFDFSQQYEVDQAGFVENLATLKLCHSLKPSDELSSERLHGTENPPEQILPENFDYAAEDTALAARLVGEQAF